MSNWTKIDRLLDDLKAECAAQGFEMWAVVAEQKPGGFQQRSVMDMTHVAEIMGTTYAEFSLRNGIDPGALMRDLGTSTITRYIVRKEQL